MTVTPATIATALGRPTPPTGSVIAQQWQMWIGDALGAVQFRIRELGLTTTLDDLDQADLDFVVREAVKAQVQKPDDATQVEISVDDARSVRRYSSSTGVVTIRDHWWKRLGLESTDDTPHSIDLAATARATALQGPVHDAPLYRRPW